MWLKVSIDKSTMDKRVGLGGLGQCDDKFPFLLVHPPVFAQFKAPQYIGVFQPPSTRFLPISFPSKKPDSFSLPELLIRVINHKFGITVLAVFQHPFPHKMSSSAPAA